MLSRGRRADSGRTRRSQLRASARSRSSLLPQHRGGPDATRRPSRRLHRGATLAARDSSPIGRSSSSRPSPTRPSSPSRTSACSRSWRRGPGADAVGGRAPRARRGQPGRELHPRRRDRPRDHRQPGGPAGRLRQRHRLRVRRGHAELSRAGHAPCHAGAPHRAADGTDPARRGSGRPRRGDPAASPGRRHRERVAARGSPGPGAPRPGRHPLAPRHPARPRGAAARRPRHPAARAGRLLSRGRRHAPDPRGPVGDRHPERPAVPGDRREGPGAGEPLPEHGAALPALHRPAGAALARRAAHARPRRGPPGRAPRPPPRLDADAGGRRAHARGRSGPHGRGVAAAGEPDHPARGGGRAGRGVPRAHAHALHRPEPAACPSCACARPTRDSPPCARRTSWSSR